MPSGQGDVCSGRADVRSGQGDVCSGRADVRSGQGDVCSGRADVRSGQGDVRSGRTDVRSGRTDVRSGRTDVRSVSVEVECSEVAGEPAPSLALADPERLQRHSVREHVMLYWSSGQDATDHGLDDMARAGSMGSNVTLTIPRQIPAIGYQGPELSPDFTRPHPPCLR